MCGARGVVPVIVLTFKQVYLNIFEIYERAYGVKFRSGNLLENGNKSR